MRNFLINAAKGLLKRGPLLAWGVSGVVHLLVLVLLAVVGVRIAPPEIAIRSGGVNDITYFYESQPLGLPAAEDFHFHPVEPLMARASLTWKF